VGSVTSHEMSSRGAHDPEAEEVTDAIVDGDRTFATGTARAALRHRDFRIIWTGTFASNIGTWMQNVLLGAFAQNLTHDATYVALIYFAQLGPLLFLAVPGGVLADMVDRRKLLIWMQLEQLVFSFLLAFLAAAAHPNKWAIFACVFAIGVGNAFSGPALGAILPTLVPREDLPGAVSLQSVQMNLSRVIGPPIGALLYGAIGIGTVFGLNALTYLFAVAALLIARGAVQQVRAARPEDGGNRLFSGLRIAYRDRLIRRLLITMSLFSLISLQFVPLMPTLAEDNLGIGPKDSTYGWLYAVFGLGAALGAVTIGTFLAHHNKARIARSSFVAFALLLAIFAVIRTPAAAFPAVGLVGYAYFLTITSLSTVLQEHLDNQVRGRIMALWIMSFGGMVPLGALIGGPLVDAGILTITELLLVGAAFALVLAWYCDLIAVGAPAD
jgi:MFS family permease